MDVDDLRFTWEPVGASRWRGQAASEALCPIDTDRGGIDVVSGHAAEQTDQDWSRCDHFKRVAVCTHDARIRYTASIGFESPQVVGRISAPTITCTPPLQILQLLPV